MTPSKIDPFALLGIRDDTDWPNDFDVQQAAIDQFDPHIPAPLISLLEAEDDIVTRRGLYLFGELGKKAFVVLDQALKLADHPSEFARSSLMDGVICYPRKLNPYQVKEILPLSADNGALVREKMIAFIAAVRNQVLEAAIALLDERQRCDHAEGFQYLLRPTENIQALFDGAISRVDVRSAYALASIERMAHDHVIASPPVYEGNAYVPSAVVAHARMWIGRGMGKRP